MSERFAAAAARLAGWSTLALGWSPDQFWAATPAEIASVAAAAAGETVGPPDPETLARLKEAFPDG